MKAAVCRAFGSPLVIEEIEAAPPAAGEVSVRLSAVAICHSDIHFAEGAWGGTLPAVYGHEAAGIVSAVGDGVEHVGAGDYVVVSLIRSCGVCASCAAGQPVFCQSTVRPDPDTVLRTEDGSPIHQGLGTAAFAELVVVHASQVVAIPQGVPAESAALLGCAVLTGVGAVLSTASVEPGSSVVVIGTGGVGLNAVQGAVIAGADAVVAIDVSTGKLEAARLFGATDTIDASVQDPVEVVASLTNGRRADYVFVTVGAASAIDQALSLVRRGGTVVIVGMPASGVRTTIDPGMLAEDGVRIVGSKMGSANVAVDVPRLVELYRAGRLKLDELVSGRYVLDDINEAIASVKGGEALRNVIVFEGGRP